MPHHGQAQAALQPVELPPPGRLEREAPPTFGPALPADWRDGLPTYATARCTLRALTEADAASLCAHLATEEVARFISPPPTSVEGFEAFIRWAHREQALGRYACFGVVPAGQTAAVGLFQVCLPKAGSDTAEWGFVLGAAFWGTGIFLAGARKVLEFVFAELGIERLEARCMPENGRGTGALHKVGARRERLLRGSFERLGERLDQVLWVIDRRDWWARLRDAWRQTVH
jgi:ribosomal-protein-alanine N-acetyltransferase